MRWLTGPPALGQAARAADVLGVDETPCARNRDRPAAARTGRGHAYAGGGRSDAAVGMKGTPVRTSPRPGQRVSRHVRPASAVALAAAVAVVLGACGGGGSSPSSASGA